MRRHTLAIAFSLALLAVPALAITNRDDRGDREERARHSAPKAEITLVALAGATEGGLEYAVSGTLAPNASAQLGILYSSGRARWIEVGTTVRANSKGEFFGMVESHAGPKVLAIVLLDRGKILDMAPVFTKLIVAPGGFSTAAQFLVALYRPLSASR